MLILGPVPPQSLLAKDSLASGVYVGKVVYQSPRTRMSEEALCTVLRAGGGHMLVVALTVEGGR